MSKRQIPIKTKAVVTIRQKNILTYFVLCLLFFSMLLSGCADLTIKIASEAESVAGRPSSLASSQASSITSSAPPSSVAPPSSSAPVTVALTTLEVISHNLTNSQEGYDVSADDCFGNHYIHSIVSIWGYITYYLNRAYDSLTFTVSPMDSFMQYGTYRYVYVEDENGNILYASPRIDISLTSPIVITGENAVNVSGVVKLTIRIVDDENDASPRGCIIFGEPYLTVA